MARGKKRSEQERRGWVARWGQSGQTAQDFAEKHGLAVSSLYQWRQKLGGGETARAPAPAPARAKKRVVKFVEVPVRTAVANSEVAIELVLPNGVVVRVRGDVEEEKLRAILGVARAC